MAKNSMKPRIRFKGFTDAWEQRKLGEMGETYAGLSSKSKEDFGHGEAEFVPYMNVFTNPIADVAMTEAIEIDDRQAKVKNGDVLFTTSSETPEEVGMSSVWLKNGSNTYLNSFCFGFRASESINSYYLAYMLRSSGVRRKIVFLAQGISRYNISKKKMMEIKVPMPISAEQRQLGEIFRQLDNLITLHQRKYDKIVNIKKALLEKMFPAEGEEVPKIRFKGFTEAWEQRKLGDVGKAQSGIGFPDREQGGKEGVPFYKVSDMNNYGNEHEMHSANNYVTEEQCRRNGWTPITEISVVFAKVGAAIMLNRKRLVRFSFLLDNNTMAYRFGSGWDINFGKTLFERVDLTELVQIGALPSYNATDVESVEISMPDKPEQYQIGEFFKQLDNLITLHQRQLEKLKNIKAALLEKMFV